MIDAYVRAALERAKCEYLSEDGIFFCEIPGLQGVWSSSDSEQDARSELADVVEDWVRLGLELGHHIPVLDSIDLNTAHIY